MISEKKHTQQLAAILLAKEIDDIIISPGSRSGPLAHTLAGCGKFNCRSIVDERSAAYFAIGLAQATQKPVVLVCSSGTASLNYAPAVAEAFYLNIPLIVITADRPNYWINQGESQSIQQQNIYKDFTKKEVSLPLGESEKELWFSGRSINECLNLAVADLPGPVHINIPFEEPLHQLVDAGLPDVNVIEQSKIVNKLEGSELGLLAEQINQSQKVLVLVGQQEPDSVLENEIVKFAEKSGAVVLTEHLSNLNHPSFCKQVDLLMPALQNDQIENFQADLLITLGGQFVSKSIKQFLRKYKAKNHWQISLSDKHFDTYQSLTKVICLDSVDFFSSLTKKISIKENGYQKLWKEKENQLVGLRADFVKRAPFCDLTVVNQIQKFITEHSILHLGNSSSVRYALLNDQVPNITYFSNRGTSGIDGSLSTAVGFASGSQKLNTIILGDLSFFYDSNALWNNYLKDNLRVIVVNNRGGNIFGMIKGPSDSPVFHDHFFTENKFKAEGIAKAFDLDYLSADNADDLTQVLSEFYSSRKKATLLEIFTDAEISSQQFRGLFEEIKK